MSEFGGDYHSSSRDQTWGTPQPIFDYAVGRWGAFDLDAAANDENSKCDRFIGEAEDALEVEWIADQVWLNPPYGRSLLPFAEKVLQEVALGNCRRVVVLVAARTETRWFLKLVESASEVVFFAGRLKFSKAGFSASAPFPSCFIVVERCPTIPAYPSVQFGLKVIH